MSVYDLVPCTARSSTPRIVMDTTGRFLFLNINKHPVCIVAAGRRSSVCKTTSAHRLLPMFNGWCRGKNFCIQMYWTPAKILLSADVDEYSFANAEGDKSIDGILWVSTPCFEVIFLKCTHKSQWAPIDRWYPAERALPAMLTHGRQGPFGRIPSRYGTSVVSSKCTTSLTGILSLLPLGDLCMQQQGWL